MKKTQYILVFTLLFSFLSDIASAQELWGVTTVGGTSGGGVLFKTDINGNNYTVKHNFLVQYPGGMPEYTHMIEAGGKLYGLTPIGGTYNEGVLFEYNPATGAYGIRYSFSGATGKNPHGSLMQAANGKLYGMTNQGGSFNVGVIFEFDLSNNQYTLLHEFGSIPNDGAKPSGNLIQATNGKLYGMTYTGGAESFPTGFGAGIIFEYDLVSGTYSKKYDFNIFPDGSNPGGSLMQASDGKLYGTTSSGGPSYLEGYGTIFSYDIASDQVTKRVDFTSTSGNSSADLIQTPDGRIFGASKRRFFEFLTSSNSIVFHSPAVGGQNTASPVLSNGVIYGLTNDISYAFNVLYKFTLSSNTYSSALVISNATSNRANGYGTRGALLPASNGKMYGLTTVGGAGNGVIFEYDPVANTYTKKIDFSFTASSVFPTGHLIHANNGRLYGIADNSSYEYDLSQEAFSVRSGPSAWAGTTLTQATNGVVYVTKPAGGDHGAGFIGEYSTGGGFVTIKRSFNGMSGGRSPFAKLLQASNGMLYGVTETGGLNSQGVLYEYDQVLNLLTPKAHFSASTGARPHGSLIQSVTNGKFYGMTTQGGANNNGTLYEYDLATNTLTNKFDFLAATTGASPFGSLTQVANGKLYGMTNKGGANNAGVLFEYDIASNVYTKKVDFSASNGTNPRGNLLLSPNGKLYGMTSSGGNNNFGVLFEYDPAANTYTKKMDFNGAYGATPGLTGLIVSRLPQTITFNSLPVKYCSEGPFTVSATSSSGLPVSFISSNTSAATVTGNTITITGTGTTTITAYQNGNDSYFPASAEQTLTVSNITVTITASGPTDLCPGSSVTLTANANAPGELIYGWTTGQTSQSITVTHPQQDTYTAAISGTASGCQNFSNIAFQSHSNPVPVITSPQTDYYGRLTICDSPVTLVANNAASYRWSTGETTQVINTSVAGSYWVKLTNAYGCEGTSTAVTVNYGRPTITTSPGGVAPCTSIMNGTLTASPADIGGSYLWYPGGETTRTITVTKPGTYYVQVNYPEGCSGPFITDEVVVENEFDVSVTGNTTFCFGGEARLEAHTDDNTCTFLWSDGTTNAYNNINSSGTYTVTATDIATGCSVNSDPITLTRIDIINNGIILKSQQCLDSTPITLSTHQSGDGFLWSTGETTHAIEIVEPGNYYVDFYDYSMGNPYVYRGCIDVYACPPGGFARTRNTASENNTQAVTRETTDGGISYFPNPADGELTIVLQKPAESDIPLVLFDLFGRSAINDQLKKGEQQKMISVKDIPAGTYILNAKLPGRTEMKKVIVVHR